MHDVTEGGLATALRELAAATGRGVLVHRERVPVSAETRRLCDLLGADPLGLIASGSLLVCCDPAEAAGLLAGARGGRHRRPPTSASSRDEGAGVVALERGRPAPWPRLRDRRGRAAAGRAGGGRKRLTPRRRLTGPAAAEAATAGGRAALRGP